MNNIIDLLKAEQKRAVEHLAKYEPSSEEYARCIVAAQKMNWWINSTETVFGNADTEPPAPVVEQPTPAPVEEKPTPAPVVEQPTPAEEKPSAPAFDVESYRSGLRTRMADARLKGADIKAWMSEVGETKLSSITDPCKLMKLNELVTEFEKEHP